MFERLRWWSAKGMKPSVIYDIGAGVGRWTQSIRSVFPTAHIEQFEANPRHIRSGVHTVLLGDKDATVAFHTSIVDTEDTGASIYLETSQHFQPGLFRTIECPMRRLDDYCTAHALPPPEFLKLDVQGAELDVLRGATECLKTASYLLLEVSLHRWNHGAPMIEEVIRFLDDREYALVDIVETRFVQGYLLQADCLFAKRSTGLRREEFTKV